MYNADAVLAEVREEHEKDVAFLAREIAAATSEGVPVVVATHHVPTHRGTSAPVHKTPLRNHTAFGFGNSLEYLFADYGREYTGVRNSSLVAWICGHTHHNFQLTVDGTQLLSNQKGYGRIQERWELGYSRSAVLCV